MGITGMQSIVKMRKERVALERQALMLFRQLLKSERGRSGHGARAMSPAGRDAMSRRVRTIDGEILKIRKAIRRLGIGVGRWGS